MKLNKPKCTISIISKELLLIYLKLNVIHSNEYKDSLNSQMYAVNDTNNHLLIYFKKKLMVYAINELKLVY
jgi:hypothetical protein